MKNFYNRGATLRKKALYWAWYCRIGEQALYSMQTSSGVKMLGVQISANQPSEKK